MIAVDSRTLGQLAASFGGEVEPAWRTRQVVGLASIFEATEGQLAPLWSTRYWEAAREADARGAIILLDRALSLRAAGNLERVGWTHPNPVWVLAKLLEMAMVEEKEPQLGQDCRIAPSAVLGPRVRIGNRVVIGAGAVVGHPGFGWATGPDGKRIPVPQLGGVVLEDDVHIGPLSTIDAGTLGPTVVEAGAKIDAHCHVGHNARVGAEALMAAQCGLAGSVHVGRGVVMGGQVGVADHVTIGDGARIAAKSGVIGDVPPGAVVAGYPAVPRMRWLRGWARLFRGLAKEENP